ncbi:MAG TPA: hypothetical protein DEF42_18925 [Desulfosporosinus sp.]|nr:hypothetical protein [Desulfosporosinus sp.]
MPRKPRKKSETEIYHVIVRGIGLQDIFQEEDDFQRYLDTTKIIPKQREKHSRVLLDDQSRSTANTQDQLLSAPHCPKGLDIDTEEPSPCVPVFRLYRVEYWGSLGNT